MYFKLYIFLFNCVEKWQSVIVGLCVGIFKTRILQVTRSVTKLRNENATEDYSQICSNDARLAVKRDNLILHS